MGDGSGLKLTAAKYLTPKAYDITKFGGLTPDFACKDYPHGALRGVASAQGYLS
jgi:C-terminal processing protease CtpA/Prc